MIDQVECVGRALTWFKFFMLTILLNILCFDTILIAEYKPGTVILGGYFSAAF
jgi:hypothetical protein